MKNFFILLLLMTFVALDAQQDDSAKRSLEQAVRSLKGKGLSDRAIQQYLHKTLENLLLARPTQKKKVFKDSFYTSRAFLKLVKKSIENDLFKHGFFDFEGYLDPMDNLVLDGSLVDIWLIIENPDRNEWEPEVTKVFMFPNRCLPKKTYRQGPFQEGNRFWTLVYKVEETCNLPASIFQEE